MATIRLLRALWRSFAISWAKTPKCFLFLVVREQTFWVSARRRNHIMLLSAPPPHTLMSTNVVHRKNSPDANYFPSPHLTAKSDLSKFLLCFTRSVLSITYNLGLFRSLRLLRWALFTRLKS